MAKKKTKTSIRHDNQIYLLIDSELTKNLQFTNSKWCRASMVTKKIVALELNVYRKMFDKSVQELSKRQDYAYMRSQLRKYKMNANGDFVQSFIGTSEDLSSMMKQISKKRNMMEILIGENMDRLGEMQMNLQMQKSHLDMIQKNNNTTDDPFWKEIIERHEKQISRLKKSIVTEEKSLTLFKEKMARLNLEEKNLNEQIQQIRDTRKRLKDTDGNYLETKSIGELQRSLNTIALSVSALFYSIATNVSDVSPTTIKHANELKKNSYIVTWVGEYVPAIYAYLLYDVVSALDEFGSDIPPYEKWRSLRNTFTVNIKEFLNTKYVLDSIPDMYDRRGGGFKDLLIDFISALQIIESVLNEYTAYFMKSGRWVDKQQKIKVKEEDKMEEELPPSESTDTSIFDKLKAMIRKSAPLSKKIRGPDIQYFDADLSNDELWEDYEYAEDDEDEKNPIIVGTIPTIAIDWVDGIWSALDDDEFEDLNESGIFRKIFDDNYQNMRVGWIATKELAEWEFRDEDPDYDEDEDDGEEPTEGYHGTLGYDVIASILIKVLEKFMAIVPPLLEYRNANLENHSDYITFEKKTENIAIMESAKKKIIEILENGSSSSKKKQQQPPPQESKKKPSQSTTLSFSDPTVLNDKQKKSRTKAVESLKSNFLIWDDWTLKMVHENKEFKDFIMHRIDKQESDGTNAGLLNIRAGREIQNEMFIDERTFKKSHFLLDYIYDVLYPLLKIISPDQFSKIVNKFSKYEADFVPTSKGKILGKAPGYYGDASVTKLIKAYNSIFKYLTSNLDELSVLVEKKFPAYPK